MAVIDTLEGIVDGTVWFHYDVDNDVLYTRLLEQRDRPIFAEDRPDGVIVLKDAESDEPIGLTSVNWWKRFGSSSFPDSLSQLESHFGRWAREMIAFFQSSEEVCRP